MYRLIYIILPLILIVGCSKRQEIKPVYVDNTLLEIMSKEVITRSDLAYMFKYVFLGKTTPEKFVLKKGFMEKFPDGKFYGNDPINREQFAILLTRIIFKYKGIVLPDSVPSISDIGNNNYAKRPIQLVVGLKIMKLENGKFYPDNFLSGTDALYSLKRLKEILGGSI